MTSDLKRKLFFDMLRVRLIEEAIAERYHEQEMRCPVHLCIGQEAIAVGVCANLLKEDYVLSTHRSHGHYLAKGGGLKAMLAEIYGKVTGCSRGRGGSMHLVDVEVGRILNLSGPGVTKSVEKGKRIISADESLRRKLIS